MRYNPETHHRRSIRLPGHDYRSPGAYFVTICTRQGECVLGDVVDGEMVLNEWGEIARDCWQAIPQHLPHVQLDAYIVMPNHLHGILLITNSPTVGAQHAAPSSAPSSAPLPAPSAPQQTSPPSPPSSSSPPSSPTNVQPGSLGAIVRSYKSSVTKRINQLRHLPGAPVWQRNDWEHIIRDEKSLNHIRAYIQNNPLRWTEDQLHPGAPPNPFNRWPP